MDMQACLLGSLLRGNKKTQNGECYDTTREKQKTGIK